jgi:hypothetical protein
MLAETVSSDIASIAYIIYRPGTDVLALVREAMALLPPRQRWLTTFSTYFTELPAGLTCSWRCCMAGTLAATEAHKYATSGVVIDLSKQLAAIVESPFVVAARTGGLSSSTRAIVPASLPTQDWRDQDWERIAPDTSERRLKSLKSLHDPTNNDGTRMPPRFPFVSEPDGGEGPEQAVKSSQPRTLFWIIAIVWPLLLIPGMVVWHLMSESQARHDLEMRVTTLNAQIQSDADSLSALRVATNDATSAKTKNEGETILKLSATTQMDVVELQEKDQELQNEKNRNDTLIKDHKTEIESVRNKDRADQAAAVAGVNQIAEQKVAAEKEKLETLAKSDEDLRGQFSAATTQPTFFWSGGLISAQPKILLNAPKNADYSYRQAGDEEIDISELSGREIASIVFADGYLKLVAKDTQAVARSSFHNWLQLASVRVHGEEQWADFQSCSLPILINDLGKTRVFPEFAGSVDQSHIQLRKAPLCDDKWQVIPSEDGLKCTFGQHNILLKYKNGKISRDDTPNGYAGTFPPLVVDLVYRYDTTEVILCRITITSPPSEQ